MTQQQYCVKVVSWSEEKYLHWYVGNNPEECINQAREDFPGNWKYFI